MSGGNAKTRFILSCDGGGVRGAASAAFLRELREQLFPETPLAQVFDAVGGSSTGALITGALATGKIGIHDVADTLYTEPVTSRMFSRTWRSRVPGLGRLATQYRGEGKTEQIRRCVGKAGTTALSGLACKVMFPTLNMTTRSPVLWHNFSAEGYPQAPLAEVLDASSAAPWYFPPRAVTFPVVDPAAVPGDRPDEIMETSYYDRVERLVRPRSGDVHIDGGASTNTPCVTLYALARRAWPGDDIRALSVGTAFERESEPGRARILFNVADFAETVIDAPNEVNSLDLALLLGDSYCRIDGPLPRDCDAAMDRTDAAHLAQLKDVGRAWFHRHRNELETLFAPLRERS